MCRLARRNGNNTELCTSCTDRSSSTTIDSHRLGITFAGCTIASATRTFNPNRVSWIDIAESIGGFTAIDWVNPGGDISIPISCFVCPSDESSPVTNGLGSSSPNAANGGGCTRWVDVEMGRGGAPV
jgi:hypothetical protein